MERDDAMTAISVTKAREHIYQILSDVNDSSQPITITNNRGKMVSLFRKKIGMPFRKHDI